MPSKMTGALDLEWKSQRPSKDSRSVPLKTVTYTDSLKLNYLSSGIIKA